ncbi:sugar phosphate nucleotidyltransferase [Nocardia beijingensis]|uniref:sugar phosphate nucleotidyltransferase n=1 Tax=Nocardia beijingensis TaxID=95162 RepID=UPI00344FD434
MARGVILAGGTGSRLQPLTRITNKHLLPVYDRPMISWGVEAMVDAGLTELMIITGGTHAGEFLRLLGNGHEYDVERLTYAYQERAGGIGEALGLAERFSDGEPVVVLLADNIFEYSLSPVVEEFCRNPVGARLLLAEVEDENHLRHLGVASFDADGAIVEISEKPEIPPSSYAATGLYCFDATVFDKLRVIEPSARGELEITDINNAYIAEGGMMYSTVTGYWGDAGESIDAYYNIVDLVRRNGAFKEFPRAMDPSGKAS